MAFRPENIIFRSKPYRQLVERTKTLILPGFEGIPLYDVLKHFGQETKSRGLGDRARAISFNFLLAIPPFFIFLFTLVPYIPVQNIEPTLYDLAEDLTPNYNTYMIVRGMIHDFLYTHRNGLLSIAFLMGFFYSSNGVMGILRSFSKIQGAGFRKRKWWQNRLIALQLTAILVLLLLITVALIIAQGATLRWLFNIIGIHSTLLRNVIDIARWVLIIMLFYSVNAVLYRIGAATTTRWKFITAGAAVATICMILVTVGFSWFVNNFGNYNKIYGSIGTILVLMLWVFFNSFILLVGFELNASIRTVSDARKKESLPA
ncbi:YihY/virulence factor BrkB family protein [Chitinophaga ginsengisegetis]|uniref:YihY/virulence factor BrkB family protein n=1 Tax=Chitinophaga ginsengisegetis TaxID=393003 RepID=UPI000DC025B5|nr:YihY/virulence factor BrkB family protein [Chitinophaga ginsengisegetis]MDR6570444.1 membrane protein [Chitinophaga ginsengisegetis]MDR6650178.1 membrane protein [Chitinophaga ginsengisegetis]MDR6656703.1 membrane protein [Chitinophaga ginsengisegetis]